MTNTIAIYSEAGGFDSRLFFPIIEGRTTDSASFSNYDDGTNSYTSANVRYTLNDHVYYVDFQGVYLDDTSLSDVSGYITSADVKEVVDGKLVTLATMTIFLDESNTLGVPMNSADWMTPDSLLIQTAKQGGSHFNLLGGTGNDKLFGSRFGDYFVGEGGRDILTGYAGKDQFLFDAIGKVNADHIADFTHKQDKILIDVSDDPGLFGDITIDSDLKAIFHDITSSGEEKDDRIVYNSKTGALSFDDDGSGQDKAVVFAYLDNHAKIDFHDFVIS